MSTNSVEGGVDYDTSTLPARARANFWRDAVCSTFVSVDCEIADVDSFRGTIGTHRLADLTVSSVRSGRHDIRRLPRPRAGDDEGTLLISFQRRGTSAIVQDGRTAMLEPGRFALYATSRPYDLHLGAACEQIVLGLSPAWAEARFGQARMLVARPVGGDPVLGPLASSMFRRLGRLGGRLARLPEKHLCDAAGSVIAANLSALLDTLPHAQRSGRVSILLRSKGFIEDHLGRDHLTSEDVARATGVSVRYLQEIFQADDTSLMSYVWSRRLQRAQRLLRDPTWRGSSISEIALACGFKDFSHFSRRFRESAGRSARDFRKE